MKYYICSITISKQLIFMTCRIHVYTKTKFYNGENYITGEIKQMGSKLLVKISENNNTDFYSDLSLYTSTNL